MIRKHLLNGCVLSILSASALLAFGDAEAQPMPPTPMPSADGGLRETHVFGALRPLPATPEDFYLQGETARLGFDVFVGANEARAGGVFQLGYETDVSVMPEASRMTIFLNGEPINRFSIGGERKPPRRIALSPKALRSGWNHVEIKVEHRHRVDCSIGSTYELWTRIDNTTSGFQFAAEERPTLSQLPLLPLDHRGTLVLKVHGNTTQPEAVETMLETAARLARSSGAPSARLEFKAVPHRAVPAETGKEAAEDRQPAGLDVYFGTAAQVSAMIHDRKGIDPALEELQFSEGGAATLVVDPRDRKRLARLFDKLSPVERSVRMASSRRPAFDDRTVTFRDLGLSSSEFSGRLFRGGFRLGLPADAVISDYASAELKLDLGYAAGLSGNSEFRVLVNGKSAAILPLGRSDGDTMTARSLSIPLTAFRAGENHVEFEGVVARPADRKCAPSLQMRGDPRFLLLETSTITIPRLARMATLPNLAASFSDSGISTNTPVPVRLSVTSFDENSLSAAGTFYMRLALSAAELAAPKFASVDEVIAEGGTIFASASEVRQEVRKHLEIDDAVLTELAANATRMSDASAFIEGQDLDHMTTGGIGFISTAEARARDMTLQNWRASFTVEDEPSWIWNAMVSGTEAIASVGLGGESEPLPVDDRTSLVMSQAPASQGRGAVTLVTSPSSAAMPTEVAHLVQPAQWTQLEGRAALLKGHRVETVDGFVSSMYATQPLSVGNIRLVIAAWLSMNPAIHAGLLLLAALGFGAATAFAVRRSTDGNDSATRASEGSGRNA
ncbi:cellulose biosynthesis cyclic di-GMP-binding regulatory protein BcsB [Fulvimarina sp. MAC8]|uniref:cellulose biosynthesis cyclic di-GMP-binding regulatory protein BcsB n=1 Tax=Fulvimarina sp. MAC8 TaxID=3162874 RepID=UPI0032ECA821